MVVKITPNDKGNPAGKLADAELHFSEGALEGLKLIGFAIWERRWWQRPQRPPSRRVSYAVNGEASQLSRLLRPIVERTHRSAPRELYWSLRE